MKTHTFRGMPTAAYLFCLIFCIIVLLLSHFLFKLVFSECDAHMEIVLLSILISVSFVIPALVFAGYATVIYAKKYEVSAAGVSVYSWGRKIRSFPRESVCAYGCAAFRIRSSFIFFCNVPKDEAQAYSSAHKAQWKMFGNHLYKIRNTAAGQWAVDVAVVLTASRTHFKDNLIVVNTASTKALKAISKIWDEPPMLTGPMLLCNNAALENWKQALGSKTENGPLP